MGPHRSKHVALVLVALGVVATAQNTPDLPAWNLGDEECPSEYPSEAETSEKPGSATTNMACAGIHDPTHLVATSNGHLAVFASGQGVCGESIVVKYMAPGSNKWVQKAPLFDGCARSDAPAWMRGLQGDGLGDFDAPAVVYEPGATPAEDAWTLYSSVYVSKFTPSGADEPPAQACIARSVAIGAIEDPDLVWAHDDKPVYCSNMEYDSEGVPSGYRYRTEAQYVNAVDDGFGIDPAIYKSADGSKTYMTWGSGVVHAVELDATGHVVPAATLDDGSGPGKQAKNDPAYPVLSRGSDGFNEAPYVYYHDGWYYLWVNWFACCAGSCSSYEIRVGRSRSPTSGFVDKDGHAMDDEESATCAYNIDGEASDCAGGSVFLLGSKTTKVIGPGHPGVLKYGETHVFTAHYYDFADGGAGKLAAWYMTFDNNGWPVLGDYWDVCDFTGCDASKVSTACACPACVDDAATPPVTTPRPVAKPTPSPPPPDDDGTCAGNNKKTCKKQTCSCAWKRKKGTCAATNKKKCKKGKNKRKCVYKQRSCQVKEPPIAETPRPTPRPTKRPPSGAPTLEPSSRPTTAEPTAVDEEEEDLDEEEEEDLDEDEAEEQEDLDEDAAEDAGEFGQGDGSFTEPDACSGLAKKTCKKTAGCAYKKKPTVSCVSCSELPKGKCKKQRKTCKWKKRKCLAK